ncbi:hypothetical protein EVG20_g32 [Dentipellis fragilis]|uniref:Uncharacterized protein n=1 Tax=Dentipellis fragilis TaxID=205917 RepID=A0A4Y9ZGS4_9AGAM|nr:hypothetical protein EVG20_g32 [Dentipellis fragilis]
MTSLPLDKAGIVSTTLEGILYGFSVFMYGVTLWVLLFRRSTNKVNRPMVTVATMLFVFSTMVSTTTVIDRVAEHGLVDNREFVPGGPPIWFSNPSDFTFVFKSAIYTFQTVTGDGVVIYRCYKVWQDVRVIIFPIIMLCGVITTGVGSVWACSQAKPSGAGIFAKETGQWITAFYSSTLSTNFICTMILASRIWQMNSRVTRKVPGAARSSLMPVVFIIVDAGILYSAALLSALICFVTKSNGQYVVLDMIMPIISIAFYMVIVRVGIAEASGTPSHGGESSGRANLNYPNTPRGGNYAMHPLEVHITQLTESQKDRQSKSEMDSSYA